MDDTIDKEKASSEEAETSSVNSETSSSSGHILFEEGTIDGDGIELRSIGQNEDKINLRRPFLSFIRKPSFKLRKFLLRGSFYIVGVCILISGCCAWFPPL